MSQIEVDKIIPSSGTTITIGDAGDTINISDGAALTVDSTTFVIDQANNRVGIKNASPTVELDVVGNVKVAGNINLGDSEYIYVGASNDLQIYHTGSDSWIYENGTGDFKLATNGPVIRLQKGTTEIMADFKPDSGVDLYYDNVKKFETTTSGATVTGTLSTTDLVSSTNGLTIVGNSGTPSAGAFLHRPSANTLALGTASTEAMRIDSSSRLLVGNTGAVVNPGITVYGANYSSSQIQIGHASGAPSGGGFMGFQYNGSAIGSITQNGTTGVSYNTSSDYRLKENVVEITGATERLKQLQPKRFNFIADADTTVDGFLAHEVQSIVPEAITGEKDAMRTEEYEVTPAELDEEGNIITEAVMGTREVPDYQGIDQSKLVPLLVASLKEALTEIDNLKARIEALENL